MRLVVIFIFFSTTVFSQRDLSDTLTKGDLLDLKIGGKTISTTVLRTSARDFEYKALVAGVCLEGFQGNIDAVLAPKLNFQSKITLGLETRIDAFFAYELWSNEKAYWRRKKFLLKQEYVSYNTVNKYIFKARPLVDRRYNVLIGIRRLGVNFEYDVLDPVGSVERGWDVFDSYDGRLNYYSPLLGLEREVRIDTRLTNADEGVSRFTRVRKQYLYGGYVFNFNHEYSSPEDFQSTSSDLRAITYSRSWWLAIGKKNMFTHHAYFKGRLLQKAFFMTYDIMLGVGGFNREFRFNSTASTPIQWEGLSTPVFGMISFGFGLW